MIETGAPVRATRHQDGLYDGEDRSLWAELAGTPPTFLHLSGEETCDVAIIGGGLLGLSTALHLALCGARTIVLEAQAPGWGGGGRNGGQVNPGIKAEPEEVARHLGGEAAERLVALGDRTARTAFALIAEHRLDCDPDPSGWINAAHTPATLAPIQARAERWAKRGAPVRVLDRAAIAERTGTTGYQGGLFHPEGGTVNPLKLARALATRAAEAGAIVTTDTPVVALERLGSVSVLTTPAGRVRAGRVLVCTNAYTGGLIPGVRKTFLPINTAQVATDVLPEAISAEILRSGSHVSDSFRALYYYRKNAAGRFVIGGAGATARSGIAGSYDLLRRVAVRFFPCLASVPWTHAWGGQVALTDSHLPHFLDLGEGVAGVVGFNGRGVALSLTLGPELAAWLAGGEAVVPVTRPQPVLLQDLKRAVLPLAMRYYLWRDRLEQR
ncbi:NAD(P)/FAD-dependent oxidoreductase [Marinivivus vitaminiproducens]|uniref:NAD(P)/FAD-dependent oxidoreductase n=1 Tax=Marinivivus vitaminiproducens TaxID=3035935 RepID=UPI0027A1A376|nr:FAD-binding oxidoreductase [Geminicoccaceae bacterium SCSIO 64248]